MAELSKQSLFIRQLAVATGAIWLAAYTYVHSASRVTETMPNAKMQAAVETRALLEQIAKTSSSDPITLADLEHQTGLAFLAARQYKEAEPHFQKWLQLTRKYATSTARVTQALSSVANFYRDWRNYGMASGLYLEAQALDTENMAVDPAPLIRDWNNLGVLDFLWGQASADKHQRDEHFKLAKVWFSRAHDLALSSSSQSTDPQLLCLRNTIERNLAVMDYEVRPPAWPG